MEAIDALGRLVDAFSDALAKDLAGLETNASRGAYLRQKRRLKDEKYGLLTSLMKPADEALIQTTEQAISLVLPPTLRRFYLLSNGLDVGCQTSFVIEMVQGLIRMRQYQEQLVDRNLFPPVYLGTLVFGSFAKMEMSVWLDISPRPSSGKVILHDLVDREFFVVSHSLESLFGRLVHSIEHGYPIDFLDGCAEEEQVIDTLEGGSVYPYFDRAGETRFSFDDVDSLLPEWQSLR